MLYANSTDLSDKSTFIGKMDADTSNTIKIRILYGEYKNSILLVDKKSLFRRVTSSGNLPDMNRSPVLIDRLMKTDWTYSKIYSFFLKLIEFRKQLNSKLKHKFKPYFSYPTMVNNFKDVIQFAREFAQIKIFDSVESKFLDDLLNKFLVSLDYHQFELLIRYSDSQNSLSHFSTIFNISGTSFNSKNFGGQYDKDDPSKKLLIPYLRFEIPDDDPEILLVRNGRHALLLDRLGEELEVGNIISYSGNGKIYLYRIEELGFDNEVVVDLFSKKKRTIRLTKENCLKIDKTALDRLTMAILAN